MRVDPLTTTQRDSSWLAVTLGVLSVGWGITTLIPVGSHLPAWPAASLGVLAIVAGRLPGRALPRGLGTFLGVVGGLIGLAKIAVLWGLAEWLS